MVVSDGVIVDVVADIVADLAILFRRFDVDDDVVVDIIFLRFELEYPSLVISKELSFTLPTRPKSKCPCEYDKCVVDDVDDVDDVGVGVGVVVVVGTSLPWD